MGSGGKTPAAPDYVGAAKEQGQSSERIAAGQTIANRPDIVTPWGTMTWTRTLADPKETLGSPKTGADLAPTEANWDEDAYLKANPDVAQYIGNDPSYSGWRHYNQYGKDEGREGTFRDNAYYESLADPNRLNGTDKWALNIGLSPEQQALLYAQNETNLKRSKASGELWDAMYGEMFGGPPSGLLPQGGQPIGGYSSPVGSSQGMELDWGAGGAPTMFAGGSRNFDETGGLNSANAGTPSGMTTKDGRPISQEIVDYYTKGGYNPKVLEDGGYMTPGGWVSIFPPEQRGDSIFSLGPSGGGGGSGTGRPGMGSPGGFAPGGSPGLVYDVGNTDPSGWRQRGQDAALGFLSPLHGQDKAALETQLANMGLTRGSEAWNREMSSLGDKQARDRLQAFAAGRDESSQLFSQALQAAQLRNSAVGQEQQMAINAGNYNQALRSSRMGELFALTQTPQVGMPQFPGFQGASAGTPANLGNAMGQQYGAEVDAYNAAQSRQAQNTQAGISAASAAYLAYLAYSDRRLKTNIELVGVADGVNIYEYEYVWGGPRTRGVMAQEVPHAAIELPDGSLMVDYSKVWK